MNSIDLVKAFIRRQVAEDIEVDLPVSAVHIRPLSKAGNTLLAVLWTNVLQVLKSSMFIIIFCLLFSAFAKLPYEFLSLQETT